VNTTTAHSPAIQFASFGPGLGFVLHKVTLTNRAGRYSAWFESDGTLRDAEHYRVNGSVAAVARNAREVRAELATVGARYVGKAPSRAEA